MISPLLADVYVHYVLDTWFVREVHPRSAGRTYLVRYAHDLVIGFSEESDAHGVMEVLPKRFRKYGLTLHPRKTRLVAFTRPHGRDESFGKPGTFDLLGFTHYWARSRRGSWVIKRKTSSSRMTRGLRAIFLWCRRHRHLPVREQQQTLGQNSQGHCAHYGITGNSSSLSAFRRQVEWAWRYWLSRRNRERSITWDRFTKLLEVHPLPQAIAIHSVCRTAAKP